MNELNITRIFFSLYLQRGRSRAQHGGDTHGEGKGKKQDYMRIGYENGNNPFYLRFPKEYYYYKGAQ